MALKFKVTKADYDALNEAVRAHYAESNGSYILSVEGGVVPEADVTELRSKLTEFRDNNRTLFTENEKLKPLQEKLTKAGITDLDSHITEFTNLKKGGNSGGNKDGELQAAIDAAMKPVKDELAAERQKREAAEEAARESTFTNLVTQHATKFNVKSNSVRHVVREARDVFELKDGRLVPKPGQTHPSDKLKDLTPEAWFEHLQVTDDNLFAESAGGGANNGNRGGGDHTGKKVLVNPTPIEMGQHIEGIAKGTVIVQRTT
jgi:hypothetical protein